HPDVLCSLVCVLLEAIHGAIESNHPSLPTDAITLWDWVTSAPREYRLIHLSPWSAVKALYLLCRYWVIFSMIVVLWIFIGNHTENQCKTLFRVPESIAQMWNQILSEAVLVYRTYAIFGNKLSLLAFLLVCLASVASFQIYVIATGMSLLPFVDPPTGPCFPTVRYRGSKLIMGFFLAPLLFDTTVTGLTVIRALQLRRSNLSGNGSPLMRVFLREGIFYFVVIASGNLVNPLFYWLPNPNMSGLMVPISVMFTSILACRLILELRDRGSRNGSLIALEQRQIASYTYQHRPVIGPNPHIAPGIRASRVGVMDQDVYGLPGGGAVTQMGFVHDPESFSGEPDVDAGEDKGEGSSGEGGVISVIRKDVKWGPRSFSVLGKEVCDRAGEALDEMGETKSEPVSDKWMSPPRASNMSHGVMVNVESHQVIDPAGAIELKTRGRRTRKNIP
ncbi:hypothetical protein FRB97_003751, partial [Tulasnella sp. 331]